jgi:hypothetical protein
MYVEGWGGDRATFASECTGLIPYSVVAGKQLHDNGAYRGVRVLVSMKCMDRRNEGDGSESSRILPGLNVFEIIRGEELASLHILTFWPACTD